jgi:formylmethanofuran dehydrogenase subunit D
MSIEYSGYGASMRTLQNFANITEQEKQEQNCTYFNCVNTQVYKIQRIVSPMKIKLLSGRTTKQGVTAEIGKTSDDYLQNVALIQLNPAVMEELNVVDGDAVEVQTNCGSVVVKCTSADIEKDMGFMPYGPWANLLIGGDTQCTGMPDSKGVEAEVRKTDKSIDKVDNIMQKIVEGRK